VNEVGPTPRALLNLARARVHARLERGIEFPLLVVSAPRGFGKTTVLREFLMTTNRPYRYLPVTSAHGDLLGFMRAFADALGDVVPALQTSFMGVYDRMHQAADAPAGIAAWAVGHLEPIEGTLLLDDLENISDERVVGLLTELVDRTAHTKIRWILVSQSADRFPIARWLAADRMDLPIEDDDLALTAQDLGAALERAQSPFAPDELRDVCLRVGDWPAALALALNENGAPPTRESDPDGVALPYASFAQRAYGALCERDQRFLLETCVYKHFDLGVLTAAGWENTESLLARLSGALRRTFRAGLVAGWTPSSSTPTSELRRRSPNS
jgi:LuxR family maltose regulon positive regulatory protein